MRSLASGLLFFALSASLTAQTPEMSPTLGESGSAQETPASEPTEAKEEDTEAGLPIAASAWCTVSDSKAEEVQGPSNEENPPVEDETESPIGCDAGIGASLYRWRRLAIVGVLGSKSVGAGLGWIIGRPMGRTLAVAVGYVCPWSSQGIVGNDCQLALGATVSLLRSESP